VTPRKVNPAEKKKPRKVKPGKKHNSQKGKAYKEARHPER
jgi:hypothetical protein